MDEGADVTRTAVVVLGMHRSGTSAVAGLLAEMGLAPPLDPLPPHPDNPKGYFEPVSVVQANEAFLAEAGSSWFDLEGVEAALADPAIRRDWAQRARAALRQSFGEASALVLKEPRINRLAPVWFEALAAEGVSVRCVVVARDPLQTARSLATRDGCSPAYAGALWLRHTAAAEAASRPFPRLLLDYADLLAAPAPTTGRIRAFLGELAVRTAPPDFIDPKLNREGGADPKAEAPFDALAEVHRAFATLAATDDPAARAAFEAAVAEAERRLDARDLIRREMVMLWENARLARKHARGWKRRARKAEAALAEAGSAAAPGAPTNPYDAVPEAVVARVRDSGLFDADWYRSRYPDAVQGGVDPIRHYLAVGAALGHDPGPLFQTDLYVRQMAEAEAAPRTDDGE